MANIKIPKKIFEKEIGKLTEEMQNKILLFGTPIESITNEEIELEIFPNRPDLLSYHGFKRSFMAFLGKRTGLKTYRLNKPEKNYKVTIDSSVKNIRPYTACAVVKKIRLNDEKIKEIIEVQEKLHSTIGRKRKKIAIGIYPLEKIKFPITFKALEPDKIKFQPLESEREMSGLEILQRHSAGREYAHLLTGKSKFPIFIDSKKEILSMPPIINSQLTGKVTEKTKELFIECSGSNLELCEKCLNIITTLFSDMGGKIYQVQVKPLKTTPDLETQKTKLSKENLKKILGIDLTEKQIKESLEKTGHNYKKGVVESPAWRNDLLHEVDIIEEIAIGYGYEKFQPELPEVSSLGKESETERRNRKISQILAGLKLIEVSNYHLTTKKEQFEKMNLPDRECIEIKESKTEYNILRENLGHYLIKNLSENQDSEYPQKIFEIGKVFSCNTNTEEKDHLAIAISPGNFTDLKEIIGYLSRMIDKEIEFKESTQEYPWLINGRIAEIFIENKKIGYLGEIHPKTLKNWKMKMPISLLELDLDEVFD